MKKFLPIFILIAVFFTFKLTNLGVRLSDSNIYFYTGYSLLQGKILYKDVFFTNFPLLPYISSFYFLITGGSLKLFFLSPVIEVCAAAFLIYSIVQKKHTDTFLSLTSSAMYLFSFIILSTSDHQSGVFAASLFAILSYYFYLNNKNLLTGIFIALSLLTKVYFIPILLSYAALFVWPASPELPLRQEEDEASQRGENKNFRDLQRILVGGIITTLVIMLPTLFLAFPEFIKDVFTYSLTRSQGIEKSGIFWFFITHDFPLFILLIFNLITIKKNKFFGLLSFFGILFLLLYKDVYYLYLNFIIPFLALSYPEFYKALQKSFGFQKYIIPSILFCFLIFGFVTYSNGFRNLQKLNNFTEIVDVIKKEKPQALYGVNDITPVLSYSAGVPLLNNIIDTNANIYRKGILNAKELTADAISQKALLVTHGYYYPGEGVNEPVADEIFDIGQVKKSCKMLKSFPVQTEGTQNRLNLLRCY